MKLKTINDINFKRKATIAFLFNTPGLPPDIIDLCLTYIDTLASERDLLLTLIEKENLN